MYHHATAPQPSWPAPCAPGWAHIARLVIDPTQIADCGLWPDQMAAVESRALLQAMQRLDAHRHQITAYSLRDELRRSGHDAREILRRLRLTMYLAHRMEAS